MTKKKFPLRAFQYAKFLDKEGEKKALRKKLKVTANRLEQMIHREGRTPTKRQQQILRNMATTVASQKSRRMGFTPAQVKQGRGRPMLMLARARSMNKGIREAEDVSWKAAATMLGQSFEGIAKIRRKKDRDKAYEVLRKVVSPGRYTTLQVKTARKRLTKIRK